jgi:hypothetical protein
MRLGASVPSHPLQVRVRRIEDVDPFASIRANAKLFFKVWYCLEFRPLLYMQ